MRPGRSACRICAKKIAPGLPGALCCGAGSACVGVIQFDVAGVILTRIQQRGDQRQHAGQQGQGGDQFAKRFHTAYLPARRAMLDCFQYTTSGPKRQCVQSAPVSAKCKARPFRQRRGKRLPVFVLTCQVSKGKMVFVFYSAPRSRGADLRKRGKRFHVQIPEALRQGRRGAA